MVHNTGAKSFRTFSNICENLLLIAWIQLGKSIVIVWLITQLLVMTMSWFLNINISRDIGITGKLVGSRSLIFKGAEHMKMIFSPAQNLPSSFLIISFSNDDMLYRKLSIYKISFAEYLNKISNHVYVKIFRKICWNYIILNLLV